MSETPIFDTLSQRKSAPATPSLLDEAIPKPQPLGAGPISDAPKMPAREPLAIPTVGSFFAEQRSIIDARKHEFGRLGMMAGHVDALRMPDLVETPKAPAVHSDALPPVNKAGDEKGEKKNQAAPATPAGEVW